MVFRSGCGKVEWLRGKYRTTSEAITKSTINAIKLLILRSFQKKRLCNSGLKAKTLPLNAVQYGNVQSHNL